MTNLLQKLSKALPLAAVLLVVVVLLRPAGGSGVVGAPELETEPSEVASEECVAVPYFYLGAQGQWVRGGERELCGQNLHWGIIAGPSYSEHIAVLQERLEQLRVELRMQDGIASPALSPYR